MLWVSALKYYTLVTLDVAVLKTGQEETLQNYITTLNPSIVVVASQDDATAVDRARSDSQTKQNHFLGITLQPLAKRQPNWTSMQEICNQKFPENLDAGPMPPEDPDRVVMIVFTSGTSTGIPKGCVWTVRDLMRPLTAAAGLPLLRGPAVLVNTKSSQSMAPCLLYSTWHSGNAAVLAGGSLNVSTTISTIARCRPIGTALYPHTVDLVTEHAGSSPDKLASIRFLLVIGSVTTVESIRRAQRVFPRAKIVASYGMTEAAGMFGWPRGPPSVKTMPEYKGIASCGMSLPGAKLRILNEQGKVVARNEIGTLHLCGDRIASGYLTSTGLKSFYNDGNDRWYNTGDCAVLDEQGRVFILGRYDNMIRRGGMTIAPATIENVLMKKFPRHTVVVIGVSMPKNQELVCAVFHKPVRDHGEVNDLVVKELGYDHGLDDVFDLPQLGLTDWPYTVVGKLSIVDVRRIVTEYLASQKA
ncbi:fatty-acid-CoA ligase [Pochonia chlamydosporia 170]|uniref:Fatty-acid-CoA ligase n=1 Tax=Pochonia chlamydosporia 170 TaxID=1380566 RepID=A0A179EYM3_METCM|nr:fatty-acid-CoA ligase [Pochonia chlamydosporia 170]OAQ58296.1 fatty-acid-CoA ligase [Pochonia chlamydosporia 170]